MTQTGGTGATGPRVLISACLLGQPVRYDGGHKKLLHRLIDELQAAGRLVPVCPEMLGGLPTPRPAAEIRGIGDGDSVLDDLAIITSRDGLNMTPAFLSGAEAVLHIARSKQCRYAILAEKSPSCGSRQIYSGDFDGVLQYGRGVTAALLARNGITVISSEADLDRIDLSQE